MNFFFDIAENTLEASIVTSPSLNIMQSNTTPESGSAVERHEGRELEIRLESSIIAAGVDGRPTDLHILRGLGEGVMGRVFLVRDAGTSKVSALKVFTKNNVLENDELRNIVTERSCLSDTSENPFVVDLQASFQDEKRLYVLLEFCGGGDLATELSRCAGKMPMGAVVYNAAHLLEGIASLHALGIIHRDLKPENILLTVQGHLKISDFGSATRVVLPEACIEPTEVVPFGTPAYHAPEVIAGFPYDFAIDWWCLGVIVYEMVVGEHPFLPYTASDENVDIEDMQESICNGEYTLPERLEPSIRRIIRGLLRINPDRRYGAIEARKSKFFEGWDWDLVRELKYQPPHSPTFHADDAASNFDSQYINMTFHDEDAVEAVGPTCDPQLFVGFELVPTAYTDNTTPFEEPQDFMEMDDSVIFGSTESILLVSQEASQSLPALTSIAAALVPLPSESCSEPGSSVISSLSSRRAETPPATPTLSGPPVHATDSQEITLATKRVDLRHGNTWLSIKTRLAALKRGFGTKIVS